MKSVLKKVALVLVLVMVLAGWLVRRAFQHPSLTFETRPRAVFNELQLSASQKPQIAISTSGMMTMLAVVGAEDHERLVLTMSHDGGDTFSPPVPISNEQASVRAHGENSPSLVQTAMAIYATWQQTVDGPNQIMFARSTDMGKHFQKPISITDKTTPSFNGFSTMKIAPNGDIYVVWLDGRDQAHPKGTFAVYLTKSTDKGVSFGTNQRVTLGACPCCRPTIAFGDKGEVYVAWRKVFDGDIRDIAITTSTDGGKTFSEPVKIADDHWVLHACPDSGPSLVQTSGKLYAAWHSEGKQQLGIRVAISDDGGRSFASVEIASKGVLDANHPQLSVSDDGHMALTFIGRRSAKENNTETWNPQQAFVATIDGSGSVSEPQALALVHRSASYPSILSASGGRLFVGWTELAGDVPQVEFARGRN